MGDYVKRNQNVFKSRKKILVHVGTNDVCNKQVFNEFMDFKLGKTNIPPTFDKKHYTSISDFISKYENLVRLMVEIAPYSKILMSSIIHRPYDFKTSNPLVLELNREIKKITNKYHQTEYLYTWKPFLDKRLHVPKYHFFSDYDCLHLSGAGTRTLKQSFHGAINQFN